MYCLVTFLGMNVEYSTHLSRIHFCFTFSYLDLILSALSFESTVLCVLVQTKFCVYYDLAETNYLRFVKAMF